MSQTIYSTKTAIEQIEKCRFECEGGALANNQGWAWIKAAMTGGPLYHLGQWVHYEVAGEVSGVKIAQTVKLCVVGIRMSSDAERRTWNYDLSTDPPDTYHYGSGTQFTGVGETKLTPTGASHQ